MDNENQEQQEQQEQIGRNDVDAFNSSISLFLDEVKAYRAENALLRESVESLRKAIQASNRAQGGGGAAVTADSALKKFFN